VTPAEVEARIGRARAWFAYRGQTPFDFQESMWRAYWAGESGLLNATTGTGKTLAAWMGPLLEANTAAGATGIRVLWVTPLRALARDLERALQEPLQFLGLPWRVEQRTGDTSSARRARQTARPPEALVTTPESLSLLLTQSSMLRALSTVRVIIVDEWHEFLGTKRGVQLELVASRLKSLAPHLRIWGLSATLPDLDAAMRALLGNTPNGLIIRAPQVKRYTIDSLIPKSVDRFPWRGHLGLSMLPQVLERLDLGRSTLVFTNTRSQAELWYQAIVAARLDWLTTTAIHHGSIDAKVRRKVEDGLKSGELRCVVCTSSLDLGVDFPPVDQVLQIGSPKGIARLLQRAGRSGHKPGQVSRVTLVPTLALELLECAAARHAIAHLVLEPRPALALALDVLAQHLVTLAVGGGFDAGEALAEIRGTHAFETLSDRQWAWVLDFITRGGSALQGYPQFRRVSVVDSRYVVQAPDLIRRLRQNVGTIASNASITTNEYGFELMCEEPSRVTQPTLRGWFATDRLVEDLLASVSVSDLARRQFRDIARIAGLVDSGPPRRSKTSRQLQVSSGLMFDVLEKHDSDSLLLEQARREVLTGQLDHVALAHALQRIARQSLSLAAPGRLTPLSFPLWADRLQTQTLSTESWQTRIEREARKLERAAG
jgi:ATP-dependent Lhr-like helicase